MTRRGRRILAAVGRRWYGLAVATPENETMDIRVLSASFTYEREGGRVFRDDGRGCPLLADWNQYDRAFTEADDPGSRVDWTEMTEAAPVAPTYNELARQVAALKKRNATLREILGSQPGPDITEGDPFAGLLTDAASERVGAQVDRLLAADRVLEENRRAAVRVDPGDPGQSIALRWLQRRRRAR